MQPSNVRFSCFIHTLVCECVFFWCHESNRNSISLIVPSGQRFCVYFKHSAFSAICAISAMGVRGEIVLRAWILMGFLSENTGPAGITPPLYCNGFSTDWTLAYSNMCMFMGTTV